MRKITTIVCLLAVVVFAGCKKSDNTPAKTTVSSINDIKVPAGFSWESSHTVSLRAAITDTRFGTAIHSISVYDGNPYSGGHLIMKGSATTTSPYTNTLYVAKQLTKVYVMKTAPDNSKIITPVDVTGSAANVSFAATDPNEFGKFASGLGKITTDCSSGCTNTITSNTSNLSVNSGDVICVTGSNITVSFSGINGGMIRVCGTNVTLQNVNLNGSATLLISSSGSCNAGNINFNSSSATLENDGTLNATVTDGGVFNNYGTLNNSGDFNINSTAGAFLNEGTMNVSGNFNNSSNSTSTNSAKINVAGNFQQNSGGPGFINNCSLIISGNYNQNNLVKNYNLIKVTGTSTINNSTELDMYNSAMLETVNFMGNSPVKGYGSTSLVKITGFTTVNSGGGFSGALQVYSPNSTINSSYFSNGAATGNSVYIATSDCNADGNGTPTVTDTDGDGVPDNLDDYPNDATRAYNNYYPSSSTMATAAFEDQWPSKGDYDLNDLVISYQYNIVTNASNNVAQVVASYTLFATGGSLPNAFGVQFPVSSSSVSGFTGAGSLEAGQSKAVVILFTNMRNEMAQWNTVPGVNTTPSKNYTFSFNVSSGPAISTFGLNGYNPFIYSTRTKEIHLWGHVPTDLADASYFGTADDNTNLTAKTYYLTKTGLPYAIEIPASPFNYPTEGTDITRAYLHFADWAQANGSSYTDWFSNTASGYRNTTYIYTN